MKTRHCGETPLTNAFRAASGEPVNHALSIVFAIRLMAKHSLSRAGICPAFRLAQAGALTAYSGAEVAGSQGEFQDARENLPEKKIGHPR